LNIKGFKFDLRGLNKFSEFGLNQAKGILNTNNNLFLIGYFESDNSMVYGQIFVDDSENVFFIIDEYWEEEVMIHKIVYGRLGNEIFKGIINLSENKYLSYTAI